MSPYFSADGTNATRTSSFAYNPTTGLLAMETVEPDNNDLWQRTNYIYDSTGNQVSTTVTGVGITARTTTVDYDLNGHFPIKMTNTIGQFETMTYEPAFGNVLRQTGPNGLTTNWDYDSFGRALRETRPDGTSTVTQYFDCANNCPTNAEYFATSQVSGSPVSTIFYDRKTREIRRQSPGFNDQLVRADTQYNDLGQTEGTTRPYYLGATLYWQTPTYDYRGRVTETTAADGTRTTTAYAGLTTTITIDANDQRQQQIKVTDSLDQLISVTDNNNKTLRYFYDPIGNLIRTQDSEGNATTIVYDIRGRKIAMNDPDMGAWTYEYNAIDELIAQTDAKGVRISMQYDDLGRLIKRTEPEGISQWHHDTAPGKGTGKLHRITRSADNYEQSHHYDDLGRVTQTATRIIDGSFNDTYTITRAYDALSRPDRLIYPSGFATRNVYDSNGFLSHVRDAATNDDYWQLKALNAAGQVTSEKLGNGLTTNNSFRDDNGYLTAITTGSDIQNLSYSYDNLSNLTSRGDGLQNVNETFTYDGLSRLKTMTSNHYGNKAYGYDALGNIKSKSDFGDDYLYGENGAGPHAVTSVKLAGATVANYAYDANGNMTSGNGRNISYTSFNKPKRIDKGASYADFTYSPERNRIYKASSTGTTVYLNPDSGAGAHYEKELKGGITSQRHFIYGGNGLAMIYTLRSNLSQAIRYTHKDHLGSIDTITNETGIVVERMSYDAFGKKRVPICAVNDPVCVTVSEITNRGFTGHETIDEVGLIHMNGRVYDADLGRFLSADPNMQFADNMQNYNRYSYVHNNPLSLTDPSGYFLSGLKSFFKKFGKVILLVAIGIASAATGGAVAIFLSGFFSGLIASGGDIQAGLIGGFTALAFKGIGDKYGEAAKLFDTVHRTKIVLHGVVGGISSKLQGGNFARGFASAGAAQTAAPAVDQLEFNSEALDDTLGKGARVATAAAIGGTVSELGGGKFANGAVTGAFSRLYNEEANHGALKRQLDCKGLCHGNDVSGRPASDPARDRALANATLSGVGAGIAGAGCVSSGTTCGFAIVLTADALRQFNAAVTGTDPIVRIARANGVSDTNAQGIATAANVSIGVLSVSKVIQGIAARSAQTFSAGTAATTAIDIPSTANTLRQFSSVVQGNSP